MTEFKLWHTEEPKTFHNQTNIYFSQCSSNQTMSLSELLRITSDIAVEDYREQGYSREFLKEKGFYILVSRVSFKIHRLPKENERITVSTTEEKPEPLQLYRSYMITSDSGEKLIEGLSSWLLVDPVARKIIPTKI